jgi:hypothetical protein
MAYFLGVLLAIVQDEKYLDLFTFFTRQRSDSSKMIVFQGRGAGVQN